uniref:SRCR domain-containing protein n=1 Tax=Seriola dumerili TaxID=41447 RepID=A0A3B4VIU7_SERDU
METSVDKTTDRVSYTHSNPLFDLSLSRSDLHSFQPEDMKPARPRRQWCFNLAVVYLIFQTVLNIFLLYKVFRLDASLSNPSTERLTSNHISLGGEHGEDNLQTLIHNNSRETRTLRGYLSALQSQVNGLCGEDGQLDRLRADLSLLNTSNHNLQGKLTTISLTPGTMLCVCVCLYVCVRVCVCPPGIPGNQGPNAKGEKGDPGAPGNVWILAVMISVHVRLVPGPSRGRVEVMYNGFWGTVCDDSFDTMDAKVICGMLGYHSASSTFTASPGSGEIWLDDLRCTGSESDIFNCPNSGIGQHNCKHTEDAGVQCVS